MEPRQTLTADEIDFSDLEGFWTLPEEEREGAFKTLREQRPLPFFNEPDTGIDWLPPGPGYRVVTRHADVLEVSRRPDVFCSGRGATSLLDMPEIFREFFGSMIELDDPRHARLRNIVSAAFTPKMLRRVEAQVQDAADQIIAGVRDRGECDFVTDIAAALPLRIICDMMGIAPSDYQTVFTRSNVILSSGDPEYIPEGADIAAALLTAGAELSELVQELGRHRQEHPTDDLTSALVHAEVDGERLTGQELGSFFVLLVVAGNETTRNAISHGLKALTDHPDQRKGWFEDFEAVAPTAVEEIVRWATPVIFMRRTVTRDVELRGEQLHDGDKLMVCYASANRDEEVFSDPYRFDVRRTPNPHVGFGGPGPHFCLGAHLARREITVMFRELARHLPDIEASGPPVMLRSNFIHGIKHLPATWSPS